MLFAMEWPLNFHAPVRISVSSTALLLLVYYCCWINPPITGCKIHTTSQGTCFMFGEKKLIEKFVICKLLNLYGECTFRLVSPEMASFILAKSILGPLVISSELGLSHRWIDINKPFSNAKQRSLPCGLLLPAFRT